MIAVALWRLDDAVHTLHAAGLSREAHRSSPASAAASTAAREWPGSTLSGTMRVLGRAPVRALWHQTALHSMQTDEFCRKMRVVPVGHGCVIMMPGGSQVPMDDKSWLETVNIHKPACDHVNP